MPRLFTALEIPRNAAMSLSLLRGGLPGARWIDVENYHITLRFIGDVDWRTATRSSTDLTASNGPSFSCSCRAPAPSAPRNRIPSGPASASLPNVRPAGRNRAHLPRIGLPSDPRKFTPHVTLARLRSSRVEDVVEYLSGRGNFVTAPFTVSRFVLLSSRDSVGGGPYLTEEVFPLHEEHSNLASNEEHPASSVW